MPTWISEIQARLYLLFVNKVYLDGLALRVGQRVRPVAERLDRSRLFLLVGALIATSVALPLAIEASQWSIEMIAGLGLVALMLPLFPVHGVYVSAVTRSWKATTGEMSGGYLPIALAVTLPMVGMYGLTGLLPGLPPELLSGLSVVALFGALYGSIKALVQVRVAHLLAYGSLALYSILWWHLTLTGRVTPQAAVYAGSVALVTGGLLLTWDRVRARYGDLDLNRIGGLARPMPRFAVLLALLVMAGVGLPPFGLFSGYIALLLDPLFSMSFSSSVGLTIVALAWFTASWYLFKLMQRLLFGPDRSDLRYEDLSHAEAAPLVLVLALLLAMGILPARLVEFVGANPLTAWNP